MSRLTRDGIAEPVSRDQILRRKRGQGKFIFPVHLNTSRIGNLTWLIPPFAICDDHTLYALLHSCMHGYTAGMGIYEYVLL